MRAPAGMGRAFTIGGVTTTSRGSELTTTGAGAGLITTGAVPGLMRRGAGDVPARAGINDDGRGRCPDRASLRIRADIDPPCHRLIPDRGYRSDPAVQVTIEP